MGTYALNDTGVEGGAAYLQLSGAEGVFSNNVYTVSGEESSYSNINANLGTILFDSKTKVLEMFMFVRNTGDRYIVPTINVQVSNEYFDKTVEEGLFDVSQTNISDPLTLKGNNTATDFISSIKTEISNQNYASWSINSSIDMLDTYCARIQFSLNDAVDENLLSSTDTTFNISISFVADVVYESNDILSVYQDVSTASTTSEWVKYGYNAILGNATPTKIETNSLTNLMTYLDNGTNGNALNAVADAYSEAAPVYSKIDVVNIDIATGEIVGKLSDLNYNFEWYGRERTISAGTTLASGRTLTADETFTLDVYTYYPTMYVRRWVVGDRQWISIGDTEFEGSVKIDEYYTGTFEATIFNPDHSISSNANGIIPRSYVHSFIPLSGGSSEYLINYYGFTNNEQLAIGDTTQANMLSWCSNLTKAWKTYANSNTAMAPYTQQIIQAVQGENHTRYIYNLLYLVKYANNDAQAMVGQGNSSTYAEYNGQTVTTSNGTTMDMEVVDNWMYYESVKGGGTIGVRNSDSKGSATYSNKGTTAEPNYTLSSSGFDNAGMNYGHNYAYQYQNGDHIQGLYTNQFLTYNNGSKRYLCDGYVGSDGYTSVFCLGMANPWGNMWTWIFDQAVISDGANVYLYAKCEDYDYTTNNYIVSSSAGYENNHTLLINAGYTKLSYNLANTEGFYDYVGTSLVTSQDDAINMIIGLPSSSSRRNQQLIDYYMATLDTGNIFGVLCGGSVDTYGSTGVFCFVVNGGIDATSVNAGLRTALIAG